MSNGKHHISVCDLNKIETDHNEKETKTGTAYVSFSTDSFLQTARDEVSNLNNNDCYLLVEVNKLTSLINYADFWTFNLRVRKTRD